MKNKKEKGFLSRLFGFIIFTLFIALGIFACRYAILYQINGGGLKAIIKTTIGLEKKDIPTIYTLILGTNEDNTDTIMIAGYNPKTQEASLLSLPRDTFVGTNIKRGGANDKINAVYRTKGAEYLEKKVSEMTGLDINHHIVIDTNGIAEVVDIIGGIDYDVPIDMKYTDEGQKLYIDLKKGFQHLNGKQVEGLVRFRHNSDGSTYPREYGIEDHGRNKTQRNVMKVIVNRMLEFKNLTKMLEIIDAVQKHIKTDLSEQIIKDYLAYAIDFNPENMKLEMVEGKDILTTAWFFEVDKPKLTKQIYRMFVFSDDIRKIDLDGKNTKEEVEKQNTLNS